MTEQVTEATEQVTEATEQTTEVTEVKERSPNVDITTFLKTFVPMAKSGATADQISDVLGMKRTSFNTKHANTRMEVRVGSTVYKIEGKQVTGEQLVLANRLTESDPNKRLTYRQLSQNKELTIVEAGVELPKLKGARATSTSMANLASLVTALMSGDDGGDDGDDT